MQVTRFCFIKNESKKSGRIKKLMNSLLVIESVCIILDKTLEVLRISKAMRYHRL